MDNLQNQWKAARQTIGILSAKPEELIKLAQQKKVSVLYFHFGNIIIFTITLVGLVLFFNSRNLKDSISKAGVFLMLAGISVRLIIEIISVIKSRQIQLVNNASVSTDKALSFFGFRKKVHGPASITTAVLYVIGFYLLSPEFNRYIEMKWMILMHVFFVIAAVVLIVQARKGMAKETTVLKSLIDIKKEMGND
jgi:hypothetical protein